MAQPAATARKLRLEKDHDRVQQHRQQQEDAALRELAAEAVRRRDRAEAVAATAAAAGPSTPTQQRQMGGFASSRGSESEKAIVEELAAAARLPELVSALPDVVTLRFATSPATTQVCKLRFPKGYPQDPLVVELLPSSCALLHPELAAKMAAAAGRHAGTCAAAGLPQVAGVAAFVRNLLASNRLVAAYGDIIELRVLLQGGPSQVVHARERSGSVAVRLQEGPYYLEVAATVPPGYPQQALALELAGSNLPPLHSAAFLAQACGIARDAAEPPVVATAGVAAAVGREGAGTGPGARAVQAATRQTMHSWKAELAHAAAAEERQQRAEEERQRVLHTFQPKPSLLAVMRFLRDALRPLASGRCPLCARRLLPSKPEAAAAGTPRSMAAEQLPCSHWFHTGCLESYLAGPPFGQEGCPAAAGPQTGSAPAGGGQAEAPGCTEGVEAGGTAERQATQAAAAGASGAAAEAASSSAARCGRPISHARFLTDARVLEQRWIAKQAREREIADAIEFLRLS